MSDHDTSTSQTDGWTTCHGNTMLCVASRGKNSKKIVVVNCIVHYSHKASIITVNIDHTVKLFQGMCRPHSQAVSGYVQTTQSSCFRACVVGAA